MSYKVGLLSDTHGLVRPEVENALAGCSRILHAGDVGDAGVLARLERIAPVTAVRGNMDHGSWSAGLPAKEMLEIGGVTFYLLHDLHHLDLDPVAASIHVVVSGHTHQPDLFEKNGVTYLNPGSAGHRRFNYPVSIGWIDISNGRFSASIIEIAK
ncbi:MAG: metallophosphoesterase family protein [Desulfosarcina sp.]